MTPTYDDAAEAFVVCVSGTDLLVSSASTNDFLWRDSTVSVPAGADRHLLGDLHGAPCFAVDADQMLELPARAAWTPLTTIQRELAPADFALVSRAVQLVAWAATSRFCGRCGTPTDRSAEHRAFVCPACGLLAFPRLAPAVIVLIEWGDRALLARSPAFPEPFYAPLAGFVEPAETLEQAVQREVREEVGLEVNDIRYFGSQPWPYPHTLLSAFTATARSTELRLDSAEVIDASWFAADDLPQLPPKFSMSRVLIDDWVRRTRAAA